MLPLLKQRPELIFGIPEGVAGWGILSMFVVAGFVVFAILFAVSLWRQRQSRRRPSWASLVVGLVFLSSGVLVSEFLIRWNLLA